MPGPGTGIAQFPSASEVASPSKSGPAGTETAFAVRCTPSIGFVPLTRRPTICGAAAGADVLGFVVVGGDSCAAAGPLRITNNANSANG